MKNFEIGHFNSMPSKSELEPEEMRCFNCALFKPRADQSLAHDALDRANQNQSNDPLVKEMSARLLLAGMSGIGDRRCSAGGSAFGSAKCIRPEEFSSK